MTYALRDYQAAAVEAAVSHLRASKEPAIIEAATGAGKSLIIAAVCKYPADAGKKCLVLSHNSDILLANAEKYRATGEQCSVFAAKLGKKHQGHPVIFGSRDSVARNLKKFTEPMALIIIDEAHMVGEDEDSTYQKIIAHFLALDPNTRILGLTATPSRMREKLVNDHTTFKHIIYRITYGELVERGWLVPIVYGVSHAEAYDTSGLVVQKNGQFASHEQAAVFEQSRLTRDIVNDVRRVMQEQNRKVCMIFAATIEHAKEIMGYLPAGSALITGPTAQGDRTAIINRARACRIRYLVNVAVLTTGTDISSVDCIALLRKTESLALFQQIAGRGLRLSPDTGKVDCLLLDHAGNVDQFGEVDDEMVRGLVEAKDKDEAGEEPFYIDCPDCATPNPHTAVRCVGVLPTKKRCEYYFVFKTCDCGTINAPSARYCRQCKAELVDVEKKLTRKATIGAGVPFYIEVSSMRLKPHTKGTNRTLRVDYQGMYGDREIDVSEFLKPDAEWPASAKKWANFCDVTGAIGNTIDLVVESANVLKMPSRLLIKREKGSKYFEVISRG